MLEFLRDNLGNIIVLSALALIFTLIIISMLRDRKNGKHSCGGNCGSCPGCSSCKMHTKKQ